MNDQETQLLQIKTLTQQMRQHEQDVVTLGKERRQIYRQLREAKIPYRVIAEHTGTSEQSIYKDLRWGK